MNWTRVATDARDLEERSTARGIAETILDIHGIDISVAEYILHGQTEIGVT